MVREAIPDSTLTHIIGEWTRRIHPAPWPKPELVGYDTESGLRKTVFNQLRNAWRLEEWVSRLEMELAVQNAPPPSTDQRESRKIGPGLRRQFGPSQAKIFNEAKRP